MNFYEFWQFLEYGAQDFEGSREDWTSEDLEWTDWDDEFEPIWIVGGEFVDEKNKPLPWLQPWIEEAKRWGAEEYQDIQQAQESKKPLHLDFKVRFGDHPSQVDPQTGMGARLMVDVGSPVLTGFGRRSEISGVKSQLASHFYPKLSTP